MTLFGYECEYVALSPGGNVFTPVPDRLPRDGTQNLVEVRSIWYPDPRRTLQSFNKELQRIVGLAASLGLRLEARESITHPRKHWWQKGRVETAGFHIHFSGYVDLELDYMLYILDRTFEYEVLAAGRKLRDIRLKEHGFEYRSLPATVSPGLVTKRLLELKACGHL